VLTFSGDSDAHIVRGLIAILFAIFSDKRAGRDFSTTDAIALFERLGLREHLTPQRSNGFRSMVERHSRGRARIAGNGGVNRGENFPHTKQNGCPTTRLSEW